MNDFEDWYIKSVEEDDGIFGPGVCSCGEKALHLECQERMREALKYKEYLDSFLVEFRYHAVSDLEDELLISAQNKIIEGLSFDPTSNGFSINEVMENEDTFYFPIGWIGCSGHLVVKSTLEVIGFGSYIGPESHIWAYYQGISLAELGKDRRNTIVVTDVVDQEKTLKVIKRFVEPRKVLKEIAPIIEKSPITLEGVDLYFAISDLLQAKYYEWFTFEIS